MTFGRIDRAVALPVFALPSHRRSEIGYLAQHAEAAAYVMRAPVHCARAAFRPPHPAAELWFRCA
jgi:non-ribosomal peptide synthetase component E (peptide arylation enzyme)